MGKGSAFDRKINEKIMQIFGWDDVANKTFVGIFHFVSSVSVSWLGQCFLGFWCFDAARFFVVVFMFGLIN